MLQRRQSINLQITQLVDGVVLAILFWACHALRYYGTVWFDLNFRIPSFSSFTWILFVLVPVMPLLLELQGFYNVTMQKPVLRSVNQIFRAFIWLFVVMAGCVLFLRFDSPSRSVPIIFGVVGTVALLVRERVTIWHMRHQAAHGKQRERVILVGSPSELSALKASFDPELLVEMEVTAEIDIEQEEIEVLIATLHKHSISRAIFAGGTGHLDRIQQGIIACESEGIEAWLVADFIKTSIAKPDFDVLDGRPMLVFRTTPEMSWALLLKALMDRVGALVALMGFLPLFVVVAIGIKLSSTGPVLFRQQRGGHYGKPFTMWKFRTMDVDAESRRAALSEQNEMSGPVFKIQNDPRITPLGRWLRKTSIDELPQLINVLAGDMSLVGPRPLPTYEVESIQAGMQRRRLSVKPGLTCLWQVSGRNEVKDFSDWVRLDLEYIDNWSLWLDIRILLRTIPVVLFGFGAK